MINGKTINKCLEKIEIIGGEYGLKLNKKKCEVTYTMNEANGCSWRWLG